jgi:hypothetical protein
MRMKAQPIRIYGMSNGKVYSHECIFLKHRKISNNNLAASWCVLMGEIRPLIFTVNIENYVAIPAIWLFFLYKGLCLYNWFYATACLLFSWGLIIPIISSLFVFIFCVVVWLSCIALVSLYHGRFYSSFNSEW